MRGSKFVDRGREVVLRPNSELKVAAYSYNQAKPETTTCCSPMFKGGLRAVTGLLSKHNRDKVSFTLRRPPSAFAAPISVPVLQQRLRQHPTHQR